MVRSNGRRQEYTQIIVYVIERNPLRRYCNLAIKRSKKLADLVRFRLCRILNFFRLLGKLEKNVTSHILLTLDSTANQDHIQFSIPLSFVATGCTHVIEFSM